MTPELISSVLTIVERIGLLPIGVVIFISQVGPWVLSLVLIYAVKRQYEIQAAENAEQYKIQADENSRQYVIMAAENNKRFERVVTMYESNVVLVKNYERLSDDQRELLTINIESLTKVKEAISSNMFCPVIRDRMTYTQRMEFNPDTGV